MHRWIFLLSAAIPVLIGAAEREGTVPLSPVQQRIDAAQKRVDANPKSWEAYNDLAAAYCRKARDNGDVAVCEQAQRGLDHSFQLSPGNFEARKLEVTVLLGKHQAADALKLATELNNQTHDDIGVWGLLVDANIALGKYDDAERDAQWILNLRAGSSLGFEKAAQLRALFGDPEGAVEFFDEANRRISQNDLDEHAWLFTQSAQQELAMGKTDEAEKLVMQALKLFPDSQSALAVLAKVRATQSERVSSQ
jgi:tetratricopeptide (TPR) repeat protein